MNTATTTPVTELADRFRCEADVPDPPRDPAGRKQYWEDTVAEAVAELRRRLASGRDEKSFQALQMIVDLEKTRIRHKAPVAGTEVETRWSSGLGSMEDSTSSGGKSEGRKKEDLTPPATLSVPVKVEAEVSGVPSSGGTGFQAGDVQTPAWKPVPPGQEPQPAVPLNTPSPEREGGRGVGSPAAEPPAVSRPRSAHFFFLG